MSPAISASGSGADSVAVTALTEKGRWQRFAQAPDSQRSALSPRPALSAAWRF